MKVLIRCDAHLLIGTGHVMRCLAIAQELMDSGHGVVFLFSSVAGRILKGLKKEGLKYFKIKVERGSLNDARKTVEIAKRLGAAWIITDGYHFKTAYQKVIKKAGIYLLCVDDVAGCHYLADLDLNQNPGFKRSDYSAAKNVRFLLGSKYALLRKEFRGASASNRNKRKNEILITMGGADPHNVTGKVLEALKDIPLDKATVLVGSMNPNKKVIKEIGKSLPFPVEIVVDAENVIPYMLRAKLAINAGGSTSWELAYLGVPSICYVLAKNQEPVAAELAKSGYSHNAGWWHEFSAEKLKKVIRTLLSDEEKLAEMSAAGRALVDGLGSKRILAAIQEIDCGEVKLRRVGPSDIKVLFNWRNDPRVRMNFFNPDPVSWTEHKKWFKAKLNDSEALLYTAYKAGKRIGTIRFEKKGNMVKTSVMLNPAYLGRGLGTVVIRKGVASFREKEKSKDPIWAEIKKSNIPSIRAFAKAGFKRAGAGRNFISMAYRGEL